MSIVDQTATVGERIAAVREQRGMSIEQASARTRIRPSVLYGIEADDYSSCGGTVYARGHIRTLARTLGMDEARLLEDFDRLHPHSLPPLTVEAVTGNDVPALRGRSGDSPRWLPVMVAVLAVVCVIAAVGLIVPRGSQPSMPAAPAPAPSASAPAPKRAPAAPAPKVYNGISVSVTASDGGSWLHAAGANGQLLQPDGLLAQGSAHTFTDPQLVHLRFGNAGGVTVTCNGRPAVPVGAVGQVVNVDYSSSSPACTQG